MSLGISEPALAQICGALDASGSATCTSASNPYPGGINYSTSNTPIHITLQPGVNVVLGGAGGNAVNAANTGGITATGADISITADTVTINNTANGAGSNNTGLRIQSSGNAIITATNTTIAVNGTASDWGILVFAHPNTTPTPHTASVTWSGSITSNVVAVESGGIQVDNRGVGNAIVVASGNINVVGAGNFTTQYGLLAHAGDSLLAPSGAGSASVTFNSGAIQMDASRPRGVLVWVDGSGSATATTGSGTVINVSGTQFGGPGVYIFAGTAEAPNELRATVASTITSVGPATTNPSSLPVGIRASNSGTGAPIFVTYTGPGITTAGGNGAGILVTSGSGSVDISSTGPITTNGANARGIFAVSGSGAITVATSGAITTQGADSHGIWATSTAALITASRDPNITIPDEFMGPAAANGSSGAVTVTASGTITTQGSNSHGIWATSATGPVQVTATNISTTGAFSVGINAAGGSGTTVNIAQGGSVMGGWQADLTGVGALGLPAAGVVLNTSGGTATLINSGNIGALSDRAVYGDPLVINNGIITGFVQFVDGDNSIVNGGTFNLRHFADTNGDGVRDTLRVATADLGTGVNNTFVNNGTLTLLQVTGATTLDSTGQYLPYGNPNNSMALGPVLQGQLIGVITFTNSGIIDLQSNPGAGDVLLITGGRVAGVAGPGTFVSNGGTLRLDTVLNQGGPATFSDTLVVDATSVAANGATMALIRNAGGKGALTIGDGILVVQVLDPARSAVGAFRLGLPVVAGPYEYTLFRGGINGSNPGDWFLRSTLNCALPNAPSPPCPAPIPPDPIPPDPVPPDPVPQPPNFRPETSLYAAVPAMSLLYGRNLLDTFHERVGEPLDRSGGFDGNFGNGAWGRIIGMHGQRDTGRDGIFGRGPKYTYDFIGLQLGHNIYRHENSDGSRDHAGLYGAFGFAHGRVKHFDGMHGDSDFRAYSLGGYWTHFGSKGWYLDGIVQATYYDVTSDAHRGIPKLKTDGFGIALSGEGGYPLQLPNGFFIEPQAQLVYQYIGLADGNDIGATVRFSNVNSLAGRVGARFGRTWTWESDGGGTRQLTAWLRPNFWHEFLGNPKTSFSSDNGFVPFRADLGGTWFEINAGVSGQVSPSLSLYANVAYQTRFNGNSYAYNGKVGLRYRW